MHTACTSVSARTANADVLELRLLFPYYGGGTLAEALELHPAGLGEAVAPALQLLQNPSANPNPNPNPNPNANANHHISSGPNPNPTQVALAL